MNVLLVVILSEKDNNNFNYEKKKVYKYEELLMPPAIHTYLRLKCGTTFYISNLIQDLENYVVILEFNRNILYRHNRNGEIDQLEEDYIKLGWSNEISM
jgi:hypothetical protein